MKEQNELLKQQLIEAISCQNLQEIQKILTLAQVEDETIILKEALVQVEYANFVWFLQEYVGKESYQQAVIVVTLVATLLLPCCLSFFWTNSLVMLNQHPILINFGIKIS